MEWNKYPKTKPLKEEYYIVVSLTFCKECEEDKNKNIIISHAHRLNFKRCKYDIALWDENEFCESFLMDKDISFWMPFNNQPERSKPEDSCCCSYETLQLCYELLHKDYCATYEWHDKYIEHICKRLEESIKQHKMRCSEHKG